MRTDTEQLRQAEAEMIYEIYNIDQIILEAERIQSYIQRDTSLEEIAQDLRHWIEHLTELRQKQFRMAMALDNISRIYDTHEKNIVESGERFSPPRIRAFPIFLRVPHIYPTLLQRWGGSWNEN